MKSRCRSIIPTPRGCSQFWPEQLSSTSPGSTSPEKGRNSQVIKHHLKGQYSALHQLAQGVPTSPEKGRNSQVIKLHLRDNITLFINQSREYLTRKREKLSGNQASFKGTI